MRAVLRDDVTPVGRDGPRRRSAWLDDDPPFTPADVMPRLTVWQREEQGLDDEGNPTFAWVAVVEVQRAIAWSAREELDDVAGIRKIVARAVVLYDGEARLNETAVVEVDPGGMFTVEHVAQLDDRMEFDRLVRLDA